MLPFSLLIICAPALSAEFLRIELSFQGKECASCGNFIKERLGRNTGVQSVEMDAKKSSVIVKLKPANAVRPSHIRDLVQQSGFEPNQATVTAIGIVRVDRGYTHLELSDGKPPIRLRDSDLHVRSFGNKKVEIEGVVEIIATDSGPLEIILVTKGKLAP